MEEFYDMSKDINISELKHEKPKEEFVIKFNQQVQRIETNMMEIPFEQRVKEDVYLYLHKLYKKNQNLEQMDNNFMNNNQVNDNNNNNNNNKQSI